MPRTIVCETVLSHWTVCSLSQLILCWGTWSHPYPQLHLLLSPWPVCTFLSCISFCASQYMDHIQKLKFLFLFLKREHIRMPCSSEHTESPVHHIEKLSLSGSTGHLMCYHRQARGHTRYPLQSESLDWGFEVVSWSGQMEDQSQEVQTWQGQRLQQGRDQAGARQMSRSTYRSFIAGTSPTGSRRCFMLPLLGACGFHRSLQWGHWWGVK